MARSQRYKFIVRDLIGSTCQNVNDDGGSFSLLGCRIVLICMQLLFLAAVFHSLELPSLSSLFGCDKRHWQFSQFVGVLSKILPVGQSNILPARPPSLCLGD